MSVTSSLFKQAINKAVSKNATINKTAFKGNIENYIGMTQVPTGLCGPLSINGQYADGIFKIPLATTEGALVASYSRGAKACSLAGGVNTHLIEEGVQRSPAFIFENTKQAIAFEKWTQSQMHLFSKVVAQSSNYAKIQHIKAQIHGCQLLLTFQFHTGDAAGQNMVSFCTQAVIEYMLQNSPVPIKKWYIESNLSGDKKANHQSLQNVRGKKVIAEVVLNKKIVREVLKSSPQNILDYYHTHLLASIQAGSIGSQGHFANGLAALFLATGQDVACVSEAANGILNMRLTNGGDLYASITVPNLIVGTVGGGTHLPTQKECLQMLDCYGPNKARKFSEICAALLLCGELSIAAAIAEGHFTQAHKALGRR